MTSAFVPPASRLRGELTPPPDKSISHRAALLGAMCDEPVRVRGFLDAADTRSTLGAVRAVGAIAEQRGDEVVLRGAGLRGADQPDGPIDVGNAGTLMRLLPGWLAGQDGRRFTLDGDSSIRRRPVDRIAEPLAAMGAVIEATGGHLPPFTVHGARLHGVHHDLPVASAQVKSCVLLAGLLADGTTSVTEPAPSRDHTERLLRAAGVALRRTGTTVSVESVDELVLEDVHVPADPSSAAFVVAAGVLVTGSRILVRDCGVNWTRTRVPAHRPAHGRHRPGRPRGAARRRGPGGRAGQRPRRRRGPARGHRRRARTRSRWPSTSCPSSGLLGAFAEGETVVRGAQELRLKESDRIAAVVEGLRGLGADAEATEDGFVVRGTGGLRGGRIDARGDHRIAMLGAVAGLASREGVEVDGVDAAVVSYPRFMDDLSTLR